MHSEYILNHIADALIVEGLDLFEKCLLVDFTMKNGNETQKSAARAVA